MSKPLIIIADTDELYLQNLERKFLEEFDDQIELEIISDPVYFEQRFETPVSVEILAVSEALYSTGLQRHNISNLCVLAEEQENGSTEDLSVNRVYKYLGISTVKHVVDTVVFLCFLISSKIPCILNHHDRLVVSGGIFANRAQFIVCQCKTFLAVPDILPGIDNCL